MPPPQDRVIDAATRKEVIEQSALALSKGYIFAETAGKMSADLRARLGRGEYDSISSAVAFAERVTKDLRAISEDGHLSLRYSEREIPAERPGRPTPEELEAQRREVHRLNCGFDKLERLPGNVWLIELRSFSPAELCGETVTAVMNTVAHAEAVIFDLRRNGGGDPAQVALISTYLFGDEPVHLNDLYSREDNQTRQWWTLPYVAGKRLEGKEVYVLTARYTFSGAEEFSYNLKNLKRATIVGEVTGGGAHPVRGERVHAHFLLGVPFARAVNPVTRSNWERAGVQPDVKIEAGKALAMAHKLALEKIVTRAADPRLKNGIRDQLMRLEKELGQ